MNTEEIKVYSVKQAAELLQTSSHQIRKMIQRQELPAVRVGREWRISSSELVVFLKANKVNNTNSPKEN